MQHFNCFPSLGKTSQIANRVYNFKMTVLQRYSELGVGTGTKQKLSLSTFRLQKQFCFSQSFRSSNLRKTIRLWIGFWINFTVWDVINCECWCGPSTISRIIENWEYTFLRSLKNLVKQALTKSGEIWSNSEISGARQLSIAEVGNRYLRLWKYTNIPFKKSVVFNVFVILAKVCNTT